VVAAIAEHGVGVMAMPGRMIRAVVHRAIDDAEIETAIRGVRAVLV
jgi:hypothetical protein